MSANELQHQRNKERFDRLFGKVKRDSNLRNQPLAKGVSLATILQDDGRRYQQQQQSGEVENGTRSQSQQQQQGMQSTAAAPVQSTLVSQFGILLTLYGKWVVVVKRRKWKWRMLRGMCCRVTFKMATELSLSQGQRWECDLRGGALRLQMKWRLSGRRKCGGVNVADTDNKVKGS